jgi:hypothetical protein
MNALLISLLVFAIVFGGALLGVVIRPLLSESHLQPDSKDVVKMATGLIGTLAALVLGLLIASANSSFDQKVNQVRQLTATIIVLDDLLAQYGPEAAPLRIRLRQSIPPLADRIWHEQESSTASPVHFESSAQSLAFENELQRLSPNNDMQRSLQSRAIHPCSVPDHSGFLAQRDFCELHLVCARQSCRDGRPSDMRAVVCRRDLSGSGAG